MTDIGSRVTVVGGGITGLAAAWELVSNGAEVTLVESGLRLGGKIVTEDIGRRAVDVGPDAFIARLPDAVALCHELGLTEEMVGVATDSAWLWTRGRLRPLPAGTVLGAPAGLGALLRAGRSGVVSPAGVARASLDLVLPRRDLGQDPTVGDLITARFGREVHERLVDPLVGGIHAGPSGLLSAQAVVPQLAAAGSHRSLLLGLGRGMASAPPPAPSPIFVSLRGGMSRLVTRLEESLRDRGARIKLGHQADSADLVAASEEGGVIVTTPAPAAAALLAGASPETATELAAVAHASVALVVLTYAADAFPSGSPPPGSGFLVPQAERRLMTACSFGSSKWPHWANEGEVVLRVSAGRWGDDRAVRFDDERLVGRLQRELVEALDLRDGPLASHVRRWPQAFPQYGAGHLDRVARIEAALARDLPHVLVAGAAYRGVGIPACIAQGRAAARRALTW